MLRPALSMTIALALSAPGSLAPRAMTVAPAPPAAILAEAELVVHGTVLSSRAERVAPAGPALRTRHTLHIWEALSWSGPAAAAWARHWTANLELVLPGGSADGLTTVVPGVPQLRPGDEVVLALTLTPWGWQPVGYHLGTWHVPAGSTARSVVTGLLSDPSPPARRWLR